MFRLTNVGEEVIGNTVRTYLSLPGPLESIVAVSDIGEVFQIGGTIKSKREIERLALRYRIHLSNADAAHRYLRFYLAVDPGNGIPPAAIESAAAARAGAERKFRGEFGEKEGPSLFDGWWQRHRGDVSRLDYGIHVAPARGGGFSASYYFFLTETSPKHPRESVVMLRAALKVSAEGRVTGIRMRPVWR
jgi:hypothetical protein